jgi:acyl transferase domain-containing protein
VELLEAHGTATKAGDAAEFAGAASVFAEADADSKQWCAIGSVKSQIGHTKGAAGAASLIKAVLALHHKVLPPTIKADRPNPNLAIEESPVLHQLPVASLDSRQQPSAARRRLLLWLWRQQFPRHAGGIHR